MKSAKRNYSPLAKVRLLMTMLLLSFLFISSGKIQTAYAEQSSCSNAAFSTNIQTPTGISATPSLDNINSAFEDVGFPIKVKVNTPSIAIPKISSEQYSNIQVLSSDITYNYVIKDTEGNQKTSYENLSDQVKLSYDVRPNFQYQVYVQAVYKASVQYTDATNKTKTSSLTVKSTWGKSNRFVISEEFEGEYKHKINDYNQIVFTWEKDEFISGNNNVEFYRSTEKNGSYTYCGKVLYKSEKFIDKKVLSEKDYYSKTTTYYYKLRYTNSSRKTAFSKPYKVVKNSAYPVLKAYRRSKDLKTTVRWKTGSTYASQAGSKYVRITRVCLYDSHSYGTIRKVVPFEKGYWIDPYSTPNDQYRYDVCFCSSNGTPISGKIQTNKPCLNGIMVKNLNTSTDSNSKIKLTWDLNNKNINGIEIYRSFKKDGNYKKIKTIKGKSNSHWNDSWAKPKDHYYKIRVYSLYNGKKAYAPFSNSVRAKSPELGTICLADVNMKAEKQIGFFIICSGNVNGIEIYRSSTGKHGAYKKVYKANKKRTEFKWVDKDTSFGKTFYYKMRAYTKLGKKKIYSKYYSIKKQSTLPKPKIYDFVSYYYGEKSSVSWSPVSSADGYYVVYKYYYRNSDYSQHVKKIKKQGNHNCSDNWCTDSNISIEEMRVYPYKMYNGKVILGDPAGYGSGAL